MPQSSDQQNSAQAYLAERSASGLRHFFTASTAMFCWTSLQVLHEQSPVLCGAICKFLEQHCVAPPSLQRADFEELDAEDVPLIQKAIQDQDVVKWLCQRLQELSGKQLP